jgi:IS5 family transposase
VLTNNLSLQLLATINATLATKGLMLKTGTVVFSKSGAIQFMSSLIPL